MRQAGILIIFLLLLLFTGCATLRQPVNVLGMSSPEKIHYYKQQIENYNFLIDQEQVRAKNKK